MRANLPIEVLLDLLKLLVPSIDHLVLTGESKRDDQILELHEVDVAIGIIRDSIEHLEELLAAPCFAMHSNQQRMLRPFTLGTPRGR